MFDLATSLIPLATLYGAFYVARGTIRLKRALERDQFRRNRQGMK